VKLAALRSLPDRTPLRVKLVVALVLLAFVGLTAAGITGVFALRYYLIQRADEQLASTTGGPGGGRFPGGRLPGVRPSPDPARTPPPATGAEEGTGRPALTTAFYLRRLSPDGSNVQDPLFRDPTGDQSPPDLDGVDLTKTHKPFTVPASSGGSEWRVIVTPNRDGSGTTVAGITLNEVDDTSANLAVVELGVGAAILVVLAALGFVAVGSSLRRLVTVEHTAEAIAAGDLSQRVPEGDERTEVGRLAGALNTMLTQIESAFRSSEASEASARASEDRMRRFVADASHELRTPLTSIRGFAELYRQGAVPPGDVERIMRRIESEATRMGLLVEDLLMLARLDQQRPLAREPVDLLDIATDAVGDAKVVSPGHPVTLRAEAGDAPVVLGDDARLRQVVGNLISNALTHTPPGTPVTVSLSTADGRARLAVADEGPGMSGEQAERVFERFYRADPARTRSSGGSGLGLSIVAALIAAHEGTVEVHTAPGEGARFTLDLPLLPA
jgi:two-component system OmpR family sensor kinase